MRISDWSSDVCSSDLPVADQGFLPDQRHLPRVADDAALLAGNPPWRRLCGGGGMSAAQFIPSPLGGEGYGALPLKAARRSWMRGCAPQARAIAVRPLTPHPASTRRASRQVFATLSPKGRGEAGIA